MTKIHSSKVSPNSFYSTPPGSVQNTGTPDEGIVRLGSGKYNRPQLYADGSCIQYAAVLDWLEITFRGGLQELEGYTTKHDKEGFPGKTTSPGKRGWNEGETIEKGDFVLVHSGAGTRQHHHRLKVLWNAEPVGWVMAQPVNTAIQKDLVSFKLENRVLYGKDTVRILQELEETFGLEYNNTTRLDIALDGPQIAPIAAFVKSWYMNPESLYEPVGRSKSFRTMGDTTGNVTGYYWGAKKSSKSLVIYNKSLEIRDVSRKKHISDFWEASGIQGSSDIWRLEMRLKSDEVKKIRGFDPYCLNDPKYLASILRTQLKGFFEFRMKSEDKNKARWPRVRLIDWEAVKATYLGKDPAGKKDHLHTTKTAVKRLYRSYFVEGKETYYPVIEDLVNGHNLRTWLEIRLPYWMESWERELKLQGMKPEKIAALYTVPNLN